MAKKKVKSKPKHAVQAPVEDTKKDEILINPVSASTPPVLLKVCRLCESKDGPFLNIFDADKITAKKIEEVMPFTIAENDDLPHKICFRCSAKLEELYEFIQKCITTQQNLRKALGKIGPFMTKTKHIKAWEEKLNKSNISNDDICDALIKKAMEGIKKGMPSKNIPAEEIPPAQPASTKRITRNSEPEVIKKYIIDSKPEDIDDADIPLHQLKSTDAKLDTKEENLIPTRSTRTKTKQNTPKQTDTTPTIANEKKDPQIEKAVKSKTEVQNMNTFSLDYVEEKEEIVEEQKKPEPVKPFNIMDYISTIKVNGVGVLFQCKLCNRNFLKMDVVESHTCAKNGAPSKVNIPMALPKEIPKIPNTVKYIKMDGDNLKKTLSERALKNDNRNLEPKPVEDLDLISKNSIPPKQKLDTSIEDSKPTDDNASVSKSVPNPPRPRAGPASKTKRIPPVTNSEQSQKPPETPITGNVNPQMPTMPPSLQLTNIPNINGRYKLVPGPNNMFTLVEDNFAPPTNSTVQSEVIERHGKKRKLQEKLDSGPNELNNSMTRSQEIIDLDDSPSHTPQSHSQQSQPYPVGLFKTLVAPPSLPGQLSTFPTPAMKKQSYTVVQTGHPSKLLISTKNIPAETPVEISKKRQKKSKTETRQTEGQSSEPYKVTLEDVAQPKDSGFFTFINVDPLLQPSYVLPTDNIIQESQISTSTAVRNDTSNSKVKEAKYLCNMCNESFSREKKLLAHIQSHFTKMDEEDQLRADKAKRKCRKS